ncbi:lipid asymmetry maintenance protein MlaB [Methylothermus subterraneus]
MSEVSLEETAPGRLQIRGDLTFATAAAVWKTSRRLLAKADREITVDLSGVRRADSAGLALLVEWLRLAKKRKLHLTLANLPAQLQAMARAYNLENLLPIRHG